MPIETDQSIADVLIRVKTVALLGASHKPQRPSHRVMQFLIAEGFTVIPVNPGLSSTLLLGQRVYASLAEIPCPVDMVDVFRNASYLPTIVDETIAQGIGTLWTQLDVVDEAACLRAEEHGIRVVMDRCPAIEIPRLKHAGLL
ncbi:MAG: putative CoA-binding protein [Halioglobus sp.]|jgi:predicted CoA-binding protein